MQKLNEIRLKHFKYFHGQYSIEIGRKNMLLYGENGSGKSSIYWALYTFLQSVLKNEDYVKKYFDTSEKGNLVNRFAGNTDSSAIELLFKNSQSVPQKRKISKTIVNTKSANDTFISELLISSDFINYKLLSRLYDFRNSEPIDLFDLFEQDILTYMRFREDFVPHDGTVGNNNANDWWNYIKVGINPRPKMHEQPYKVFESAVHKFNQEFDFYMRDITERANTYLQQKFKQPFKIVFEYRSAVYDRFKEGSTTTRIHETTRPQILMNTEFIHELLPDDKKNIERPHSFLNEAKLTTFALSIRFAIFDKKITNPNSPKLLVLDDLLISLDMSNRDIVLEIILNEFTTAQLLILTHDKSFFNLTKRRIETDCNPEDWIFKEMYQDQAKDTNIPKPFILDPLSNLSLADKYLKEFDYPACGNYLRKECERVILNILPEHLTIKPNLDKGREVKQLDDLIKSFEKWYSGLGCDYTPFRRLMEYKDLLLNPLSHDNINSPIYRIELESIRAILMQFNQLSKKVIIDINEDNLNFKLKEVDRTGHNWEYEMSLLENFYAIKDINGVWHLNNPKCEVLSRQNKTLVSPIEMINSNDLKLKSAYGNIRFGIGNKTNEADIVEPKNLKDIIFLNGENINASLN